MPADDVVAELDDWLAREATTLKHYPADDVDTGLLQRARDEIVALRAQLEAVAPLRIAIADALAAARREARDQALEEAVALCLREARDHVISISEDNYHGGCVACAEFIRLKLRDHD